ncbi:nucleolar protein [Trifolium repens]|nr:nucleolar protein [Trifolium repens]
MADIITRESAKRKANRFFINAATLMTMMVKRAGRFPLKLKAAAPPSSSTNENRKSGVKSAPKKLLKNISNKTMPFIEKMKKKKKGKEDWGDGGVWQKAIMMGDKCEPLDFSGVIYYDSNGKQVNEFPLRTPTAVAAATSHAS